MEIKKRGEPNSYDPFGLLPEIPFEPCHIDKIDHSISFIVPENQINDARDALVSAGFPLCNSGCNRFDWRTNEMVPSYHFLGEKGNTANDPALKLFRRRDLLFRFPDPILAAPREDDPWFMLTNDPRLPANDETLGRASPEGRFDATVYPIKIPTPEKLYEALILLRCRDEGYHSHCDGNWSYWSDYMAQLVTSGKLRIEQVGEGELYRGVIEADQDSAYLKTIGEPKLLRSNLWMNEILPFPLPDRCPADFAFHRRVHRVDEYGDLYVTSRDNRLQWHREQNKRPRQSEQKAHGLESACEKP
ncbi:hypothetical protein ASPCADRAFT_133612 [Aspergillus carbonarius ITEM 5010]|uniref:Uncharacterized protein n=1 Tax=Aspergillus carbonarius (strain ITEM 5010) TaxID=602072 RepID=A0A1R3RC34_ASPC5|nr:hypothetical protein ASPCADRAFT_133612 [Aspergillus carbonarius ITEM 5010]